MTPTPDQIEAVLGGVTANFGQCRCSPDEFCAHDAQVAWDVIAPLVLEAAAKIVCEGDAILVRRLVGSTCVSDAFVKQDSACKAAPDLSSNPTEPTRPIECAHCKRPHLDPAFNLTEEEAGSMRPVEPEEKP